jgi:hypothetical protein
MPPKGHLGSSFRAAAPLASAAPGRQILRETIVTRRRAKEGGGKPKLPRALPLARVIRCCSSLPRSVYIPLRLSLIR